MGTEKPRGLTGNEKKARTERCLGTKLLDFKQNWPWGRNSSVAHILKTESAGDTSFQSWWGSRLSSGQEERTLRADHSLKMFKGPSTWQIFWHFA